MSIARIGLDLAKSVFQVHGIDANGVTVIRRRLARSQLFPFFARLEPTLIGMEACWARELMRLGHEVRLIPPQYVKPYVKRNKTDAADAEAICEAVGRPNMRFVPIKTPDQQAVLALHRVRALLVRQRTATINALRGLLGEFGIVAGKGAARLDDLRRRVENCADEELPAVARTAIVNCLDALMIWQSVSGPSKPRSSLGTRATRPASVWRRRLGLGRSPPPRWSPPLATHGSSDPRATSRPGSA
jgi:transposase